MANQIGCRQGEAGLLVGGGYKTTEPIQELMPKAKCSLKIDS